jgi:hypothetical protein
MAPQAPNKPTAEGVLLQMQMGCSAVVGDLGQIKTLVELGTHTRALNKERAAIFQGEIEQIYSAAIALLAAVSEDLEHAGAAPSTQPPVILHNHKGR